MNIGKVPVAVKVISTPGYSAGARRRKTVAQWRAWKKHGR